MPKPAKTLANWRKANRHVHVEPAKFNEKVLCVFIECDDPRARVLFKLTDYTVSGRCGRFYTMYPEPVKEEESK